MNLHYSPLEEGGGEKPRDKIILLSAGPFPIAEALLSKLGNISHGVVVRDPEDDEVKAALVERERRRTPPLLETVAVAFEAERQRKLKKDKTHLKRYSSYFNKKSNEQRP